MRTKVCNVQKIDENSWEIVATDGNPVDVINIDDIKVACDNVSDNEPCHVWTMDENIDEVWDELCDNFEIEYINPSTHEYREFVAWVNYVSAKHIGEIITEYYKEQLLNVE